MRHNYYDTEFRATANMIHVGMMMGHDTFLLSGLEVGREHRGKGAAGRLLDRVLEEADSEGVQVALNVKPDGSIESLDYDALEAFYRRRGFKEFEHGGEGTLLREPKADACRKT